MEAGEGTEAEVRDLVHGLLDSLLTHQPRRDSDDAPKNTATHEDSDGPKDLDPPETPPQSPAAKDEASEEEPATEAPVEVVEAAVEPTQTAVEVVESVEPGTETEAAVVVVVEEAAVKAAEEPAVELEEAAVESADSDKGTEEAVAGRPRTEEGSDNEEWETTHSEAVDLGPVTPAKVAPPPAQPLRQASPPPPTPPAQPIADLSDGESSHAEDGDDEDDLMEDALDEPFEHIDVPTPPPTDLTIDPPSTDDNADPKPKPPVEEAVEVASAVEEPVEAVGEASKKRSVSESGSLTEEEREELERATWEEAADSILTDAEMAELNPLGLNSEVEDEVSESGAESETGTGTVSETSSILPNDSSLALDTGDEDVESIGPDSLASGSLSIPVSNNDVSDLVSTTGEDEDGVLGDLQVPEGFTKDDLIPVIGYRRQEWLLVKSPKELKETPVRGNGSGDPFRKVPEVHELLRNHPHSFSVAEITKAEGFDFLAFRPAFLEPQLMEMERRMWEISQAMDGSLVKPIPKDRLVSGMPVRVWFDQDNADKGTWFRGRLNKLRLDKGSVDLYLVDFGDLESEVELTRVFPLARSVARLPPLGFEAVSAIPNPVSPRDLWRAERAKTPLRGERWRNYADLVLGSEEYKLRCRDTIAAIHEVKWRPEVVFRSFVGPKFVCSFLNPKPVWGPKELSLRGVELVELVEKGEEGMGAFRAEMEAEEAAERRRKEEIDAELAAHRASVLANLPPMPPAPALKPVPSNDDLKPENLYTADVYGRTRPVLEESERRRLVQESRPAPKSYEVPFVYRKPKSQILPRKWERPADIAIRAWPQRGDNPVVEDQMMLLLYAESSRRLEFLPLLAYEQVGPMEEALNELLDDASPALPSHLHQKYNTCAVRDPKVGNRFVRCEIDWANPRDPRGIKIRSVDRGWQLPWIPHNEGHRIKAIPTEAPAVVLETQELAFPAKVAKMCEAAPDEDEAAWIRGHVPPGSAVVVNCVAYPASKKHLRGPPYRVWLKILQRSRLWMKDLWEEFLDYSIAANIGIRGPERGKSAMEKIIESPTAILRQMQHKGTIPMELTQIKAQSPALFSALRTYHRVRITHVGSCNAVWVQTDEMGQKAKAINSDVTGTMQEELRMARTGLGVPPLYHWELELGKSVVAKFKHDRCYYRATIIDFHPPKPAKGDKEALAALGGLWFPLKVQVRFVDYGNAEWVDAKELYIVRPELCFQEACSIGPCRLLQPQAFAAHFDMASPVYMRYLQFTLIQNGYQFQGRLLPIPGALPHEPQWHLDLVDKEQIINFNDYWEKFVSGRKSLPSINDLGPKASHHA